MKSFIPTLLSLFIVYQSYGSKTTIKGFAKNFIENEISFLHYQDYITLEKKELGYANVNTDGSYSIDFELNEITKVILKIEDKTTWFFAEPGHVYNINLDYNPELNKGRIYDKQLSLIFNFPAPNELNQQIKKFNYQFDLFIEDNILLFKKRNRSIEPKLKDFQLKMLKAFNHSHPFVKDYITYTFANTQNALDVSYLKNNNKNSTNTKANNYLKYLHKKPILYNNPEYMKFFTSFFDGELKSLSLEVNGFDISKAINDKNSYSALSKALSKYPFIIDNEFKTLFTIYGLYEISKDKYFTQQNIVSILREIEKNTNYAQLEKITSNVIEKLTKKKYGKGSPAYLFTLTDNKGESVSLSDFKGKPIYLTFFTNWSIPAKKEMKIMEVLYKKYKNKVHFISVCADNDYDKLTHFLAKNKNYNWTFLHIGKNKKLFEKYKVFTYPTYVLIDKNLKIYKLPAGRPGGTAERATEDNIERDFYDLTK